MGKTSPAGSAGAEIGVDVEEEVGEGDEMGSVTTQPPRHFVIVRVVEVVIVYVVFPIVRCVGEGQWVVSAVRVRVV